MTKLHKFLLLLLAVVLTLSGCAMATVDELYCLPKRSEEDENLQAVVDKAMVGLSYCAPTYGENRQVRQMADLDGDGIDEYLIFAKDDSDKPLKILIFCQLASGYVLMDTIEGYGFGFDFVTYAQMDDKPGVELIVGRQVSDQVMRSVSVYRFTSGFARQLMNTSYNEITTTDMDLDGISELFLLTSGLSDKSVGTARLYSYQDGEMQRSEELQLSASMSGFKLLDASMLLDGTPAIYVTCSADAQKLVTDVFTLQRGALTDFVKGITVSSVDNYYVYPNDVDADGVPELPQLLRLDKMSDKEPHQYLIQWYSLDSQKNKVNKLCTYHCYWQNWYLELDESVASSLAIRQNEEGCAFYYEGKKTLTILALTDADRVEQSQQPGRTILYRGETVIYVAILEDPDSQGKNMDELIARFHPIRADMKTEED